MVTYSFDDSNSSAISNAEPFAHNSSKEHLALGRTIENNVASDDVVLSGKRRTLRGTNDDPTTRKTFAGVIVGIAFEFQRYAPW